MSRVPKMSPLWRFFWFPVLKPVFWLLLTILGPVRVRGKRNIPRRGGLIILANHRSDSDPIILNLGCPRPIYFMAKIELFDMKVIGKLMRIARAFPVKRGEPDRAAMRSAADTAKDGDVVGIFPEGRLTEDGELQEIQPGITLILKMAGVPVMCCGLTGTEKLRPYNAWGYLPKPAFSWVTATFGEPRTFAKDADPAEVLAWVESELKRLTA